jgi:hypothetical protein
MNRYTRADLVAEFEHTRPRHHGVVSVAAPIFGMTAKALAKALYRARAAGHVVAFRDDSARPKVRVNA